jgi:hypothetical protein
VVLGSCWWEAQLLLLLRIIQPSRHMQTELLVLRKTIISQTSSPATLRRKVLFCFRLRFWTCYSATHWTGLDWTGSLRRHKLHLVFEIPKFLSSSSHILSQTSTFHTLPEDDIPLPTPFFALQDRITYRVSLIFPSEFSFCPCLRFQGRTEESD